MSPEPSLLALVLRAAEAMERAGFRYAAVGAFARNAWARVRATTDADFAVAVDADRLGELHALLASLGLRVRREKRAPDQPVPELILCEHVDDPALRADFLIAQTPFEESVLRRRVRLEVSGVPVWFATAEDVLVYKLVAGRSRDWSDAEEVVRTAAAAGRALDWDYVRGFCADFGVQGRVDDLRRRAAE